MADNNNNFIKHEGPSLDEILAELQAQLNAENAKADDLDAKALTLKSREEQLKLELRRAEGKKTQISSQVAAQRGVVKKKEALYLEQRSQLDKIMEDCRQIEHNADKSKRENKQAIEEGTLLLLNICQQEKDHCQFGLCGPEKREEMLTKMNEKFKGVTEEVALEESKEESNSAKEIVEMQKIYTQVESEITSLRKEIEQVNEEIAGAKNGVQIESSNMEGYEIDNLKANVTLARKKIAEIQHQAVSTSSNN